MRRSSTDETPYRRSPSLDSKAGSPPLRYSGEYEYRSAPFGFGFRTAPGTQTAKAGYATAQGRKYVVFYLDLSFIFLLELRRCRMAEGCMRALRYAMVFFNLLFWSTLSSNQQWAMGLAFRASAIPKPAADAAAQDALHSPPVEHVSSGQSGCNDKEACYRTIAPRRKRCIHVSKLGGCGILGVGVWLSVTQGNFATLSSSLPSLSAANLLIAVGTIIMVIGCLGCVGAVKESRPLLLSFFILLLLIFLLEILFIILFFAYQDQVPVAPAEWKELEYVVSRIDQYAQSDLKKGLQLFGTEGNIGLTNAWSIVQTDLLPKKGGPALWSRSVYGWIRRCLLFVDVWVKAARLTTSKAFTSGVERRSINGSSLQFRCCGVTNHTDWFEVYNATRVPDSCCLEYSDNCGLENPGTWWTAPCYERVKSWLQENLVALWIFALCAALTQVLVVLGEVFVVLEEVVVVLKEVVVVLKEVVVVLEEVLVVLGEVLVVLGEVLVVLGEVLVVLGEVLVVLEEVLVVLGEVLVILEEVLVVLGDVLVVLEEVLVVLEEVLVVLEEVLVVLEEVVVVLGEVVVVLGEVLVVLEEVVVVLEEVLVVLEEVLVVIGEVVVVLGEVLVVLEEVLVVLEEVVVVLGEVVVVLEEVLVVLEEVVVVLGEVLVVLEEVVVVLGEVFVVLEEVLVVIGEVVVVLEEVLVVLEEVLVVLEEVVVVLGEVLVVLEEILGLVFSMTMFCQAVKVDTFYA
ncbi:hypothetical protein NFI96_018283 [Prochilodus magdalenae]|nr:hypothetical protein NFI96_018283 [Prochilodus magdalenae]